MKRFSILAVALAAVPLASGCCCCRDWFNPPATFAATPAPAPAPACAPGCETDCPTPVSYGYSPAYATPEYETTPYSTP